MVALLDKFDRATTTQILAAAALAAGHNVEGEEPQIVHRYGAEARELLSDIREELRISGEDPESQRSISDFITKAIRLFSEKDDLDRTLADAGQAGRLNPALYNVIITPSFTQVFRSLSVKSSNAIDAIKHPDDYQHILDKNANASNRGKISIFLKRINSSRPGNDHWLLVQTHREGLNQVAQSAWRIFPDVVDLAEAAKPLDLLKRFVDVFGVEINIAGVTGKYIESIPARKAERVEVTFPNMDASFVSFSHTDTDDPNIVQVGAAYCIDTGKYGEMVLDKKLISAEDLARVANVAYQTRTNSPG
jgi:hypothetical protein